MCVESMDWCSQTAITYAPSRAPPPVQLSGQTGSSLQFDSPQLERPPNDGTPRPSHNCYSSKGSATQPDKLFETPLQFERNYRQMKSIGSS